MEGRDIVNNTKSWRNISNGAHPFTTSQELLAAAADYFQWCDNHPILEEDVAVYQGDITRYTKNKIRPYTLKGMAVYLNVAVCKLERYKLDLEGLASAMELIEQVIYTQKFEHAAVGLMNATFIARDIGLADKQEITGINGGPIQLEEISARERVNSKLASLAARITTDRVAGESE
jgi:hypothetical protein